MDFGNKWRTVLDAYFQVKSQNNILTEHLSMDAFKEEKTEDTEAVAQRTSVKKVFLKILPVPQINVSLGVSFSIKLQATDPKLYQKRDSGRGVFRVKLVKF